MSTTAIQPSTSNGAAPSNAPAKVTSRVLEQIESLMAKGSLNLPPDYSPGNALSAAWLKLQTVQNLDQRPLFVDGRMTDICTLSSVVNALHDMVIQGLSVAKNQGYFIVYGKQLVFQRGYFGDMAIAKRVQPGIEITYNVVYEGDDFKFETVRGRTSILKHSQTLGGRTADKIVGAYCAIYDGLTGDNLGAEVMDIEQIRKSWSMSKTYKPDGGKTPHHNFAHDMCLRTVIRKRLKPIINSSDDAMLMAAMHRQELDAVEGEVVADATLNANQTMLSLDEPQIKAPDAPVVQAPVEAEKPAKKDGPKAEAKKETVQLDEYDPFKDEDEEHPKTTSEDRELEF